MADPSASRSPAGRSMILALPLCGGLNRNHPTIFLLEFAAGKALS